MKRTILIIIVCLLSTGCAATAKDILVGALTHPDTKASMIEAVKGAMRDSEIKATMMALAKAAAGEAATKAVGKGTPFYEIGAYILAVLMTGGVGTKTLHTLQKKETAALHALQKKDRREFHGERNG